MIRLIAASLLMLTLLNGCIGSYDGLLAIESAEEAHQRFLNLTESYIETCTTVTGLNDSLEAHIMFSTQQCYKDNSGDTFTRQNDQFLIAYVHKEFSDTIQTVRIYNMIYRRDWTFPYNARYRINENLMTELVNRVHTDVTCIDSYNCFHTEHYTFDLSFYDLLDEAERRKEQGFLTFEYRINTRNGGVIDRVFNVSEIIGLKNKIDDTLNIIPMIGNSGNH